MIGLVTALLSALLQDASTRVESDRTISQEDKKEIQLAISIAQSAIMIFSILFGVLNPGNLAAELEPLAGTAMRYVGAALDKISTYLRHIANAVRLEQKAKGILFFLAPILQQNPQRSSQFMGLQRPID